jgi:hypothetical protein
MFQDYYRQFADDARKLAAAYVEKQSAIDSLKQDMAQEMQLVKEPSKSAI